MIKIGILIFKTKVKILNMHLFRHQQQKSTSNVFYVEIFLQPQVKKIND